MMQSCPKCPAFPYIISRVRVCACVCVFFFHSSIFYFCILPLCVCPLVSVLSQTSWYNYIFDIVVDYEQPYLSVLYVVGLVILVLLCTLCSVVLFCVVYMVILAKVRQCMLTCCRRKIVKVSLRVFLL